MQGSERIAEYVRYMQSKYNGASPIYEIVLFEHPCKDTGGYPDDALNHMGFYYELDTAIQAMNENWCDIQETCFFAGFILCHFPGVYQCAGPGERIYFLWDVERQGFFEADEPELFKHVAY